MSGALFKLKLEPRLPIVVDRYKTHKEIILATPSLAYAYFFDGATEAQQLSDSSGNGNNLTRQPGAGVVMGAPGLADDGGLGVQFTTGVDGSFLYSDASGVSVAANTKWTMECLFTATAWQANYFAFVEGQRNHATGGIVGIGADLSSGNRRIQAWIRTSNATTNYSIFGPIDGTLVNGPKRHVILRRDGTSVRLYINGVFSSETTIPINAPLASTTRGVGSIRRTDAASGQNTNNWRGVIDNVCAYTRALTDLEIKRHSDAAFALNARGADSSNDQLIVVSSGLNISANNQASAEQKIEASGLLRIHVEANTNAITNLAVANELLLNGTIALVQEDKLVASNTLEIISQLAAIADSKLSSSNYIEYVQGMKVSAESSFNTQAGLVSVQALAAFAEQFIEFQTANDYVFGMGTSANQTLAVPNSIQFNLNAAQEVEQKLAVANCLDLNAIVGTSVNQIFTAQSFLDLFASAAMEQAQQGGTEAGIAVLAGMELSASTMFSAESGLIFTGQAALVALSYFEILVDLIEGHSPAEITVYRVRITAELAQELDVYWNKRGVNIEIEPAQDMSASIDQAQTMDIVINPGLSARVKVEPEE